MNNREQQYNNDKKWRARILAAMGIMTVVGMLGCGYGHAALSRDLLFDGDAAIKPPAGGFGITYMQEMTPKICYDAKVHTQEQLEDKRDGQKYWVIKYADGNCWMAQDLKLQLSPDVTLTPELTATEKDWTPVYGTLNTVSVTPSSVSGDRSYDFGMYIHTKVGAGSTNCGANKTSLSQCPTQVITVGDRTPSSDPDFYEHNGNKTYNDTEYDAHYLIGTYYQPAAAIAYAPGDTLPAALERSASSICPKGWVIPTGFRGSNGSADHTDFMQWFKAENAYNSNLIIGYPPYYYKPSGVVSALKKLNEVGGGTSTPTAYWSGTTGGGNAPKLYYYGGSSVSMPTAAMTNTAAVLMRCMAYGNWAR